MFPKGSCGGSLVPSVRGGRSLRSGVSGEGGSRGTTLKRDQCGSHRAGLLLVRAGGSEVRSPHVLGPSALGHFHSRISAVLCHSQLPVPHCLDPPAK